MSKHTSGLVSLADIDQELGRVRLLQEKHREALEELGREEARLSETQKALSDFLEYKRSRLSTRQSDVVIRDGPRVAVFQVKQADGRGIVTRALAALKAHGEPMDTWALINKMQEDGFTSSAENIYLSVYGTVNRASKRPGGDLVKVNKLWALREWYPDGLPEEDADGNSDELVELLDQLEGG